MTHSDFVTAYRNGEVRVQMDPQAAGRMLSARLLLPFVMMPVIGAGVALALIGWIYTGLMVIVNYWGHMLGINIETEPSCCRARWRTPGSTRS